MKEVIFDTIIDLLKIIPFLFVAFLIMEYFEYGMKKKTDGLKNHKVGPLVGSLLGMFPQCGFSVMATNLFSSKVITMGTLLAVYLSTSDEMLPLLISHQASFQLIISVLLIKLVVGIIFGYLIDLFYKRKKTKENFSICEHDHCHCHEGIFKSSLIHTLKITLFILVVTFILNTLIYYVGEEAIGSILLKNSIFGPFLASILGLLPNCAASIIITELYLNGVITSGMLVGGLLTGSGLGILVLFKTNKNLKENLLILVALYLIGSLIGVLIDLFQIVL